MEWQPMDTAPRDGQKILVMCGGRHQIVYWWVPVDNHDMQPQWQRADSYYSPGLEPTHWMPLPPAPGRDLR